MIDKTKLRLGQKVMWKPDTFQEKLEWEIIGINANQITLSISGFERRYLSYDDLTPEDIIPTEEELAIRNLILSVKNEIELDNEKWSSWAEHLQFAILEVEKSRGV